MATTTAAHPAAGSRRDFNGMERVRLRAAGMFEQGTTQAEVPTAGHLPPNRPPLAPQVGTGQPRGAAGHAGAGPNWTPARAARSSTPYYKARWRTGLIATFGPASAWSW